MAARDVDDAALVAAAQGGDREAFGELFRRHSPSLSQACGARLANRAEAEEVVQAAFVRAFERIDRCRDERRFGSWVQVIARNLCIDAIRARARTQPEESPLTADNDAGPNEPEECLLEVERAQDLRAALASLPSRQREVVLARSVDERGPGEIAALMGLSISAVNSLLLRGRRQLALAYQRVL